ncbi:sugar translocase [Paraburkholderia guartelaensis]|uniref:sugar translocase n=1 Tax=Paraburkholderia guartelaensis TaxID=2546446 RepID=UPI002AB73DF6|nr:sugar translocase [Paraburkholderia guartelaensis]
MESITAAADPQPRSKIKVDIAIGAALALLSTLLGWHFIGGRAIHLGSPLDYSGDGLFLLASIQHMIEGGWVYVSSRLGAPFGSVLYDYPVPDSGTLLVLKIAGKAFHSAGIAYNLYYLVGFALDAIASYAVLRYLGVRRALAFAGAFAYTMLPFHFMRIGHLFYTWYFGAPIFTWYAFRVYRGDLRFSGRRGLLDTIALLVLTTFGVYYAFFGAMAIAAATLVRVLKDGTIASARTGIVACTLLLAGVVANVIPTLAYEHSHGINNEVAARIPSESETYGMKVAQLLLPWPGHRAAPLARLTAKYNQTFPLVNENQTASLGLLGSVGFIGLLVILLGPRRGETLPLLAALTLVFVLFCSIGGLSSIFAMLISAKIRAWNRASVFVAFFAIASAVILLQRATQSWKRPGSLAALSVALCAFVVWDQTPATPVVPFEQSHANYENDKSFGAAVERVLPVGSTVYQLPYMAFPEVPPLNDLAAYDQFAGYLNTTALRWSYGGMKGREGDLFFRQLATQPVAQQVAAIREKGFSAVWVDRRGYADRGKQLEADLAKELGHGPALISQNGNQVLFIIQPSP